MAKEVRIHLTAAQKARLKPGANKTSGSPTSSRQKGLNDPASLGESTDLAGSGADLTGSRKRRATALIPLP